MRKLLALLLLLVLLVVADRSAAAYARPASPGPTALTPASRPESSA